MSSRKRVLGDTVDKSTAPDGAITFSISGRDQTSSSEAPADRLEIGTLRQSVRPGTDRGGVIRVMARSGEDIVVLNVVNGPALVLHPENARDLLLAQVGVGSGTGAAGVRARSAAASHKAQAPVAATLVDVPMRLQWRDMDQRAPSRQAHAPRAVAKASERGSADVLVGSFDVVSMMAAESASDRLAAQVVSSFDGKIEPGLYDLQADSLGGLYRKGERIARLPKAAASRPTLVLVHGTFSDTVGTFGLLWSEHPERIKALVEHHEGRVYGFEHPTLGVGPIANALALAKCLPVGTRLHLLTHSRGGLVAEVLARACGLAQSMSDEAVADVERYGSGSASSDVAASLRRVELRKLVALCRDRHLGVDRIVRVACPAHGTLLASKRLDACLSVVRWTLQLAGVPVAPSLLALLGAVALHRTDPVTIPGLEAQMPGSSLIEWLASAPEPLAGQLRIVAGDIQGDSITSWLKTLVADAYYWTDSDLVVQTRSMYGGARRVEGASFFLDRGGKVSHFGYFTNARTVVAVVDGLTQDAEPLGFTPIGESAAAGASAEGERGRSAWHSAVSGSPAAGGGAGVGGLQAAGAMAHGAVDPAIASATDQPGAGVLPATSALPATDAADPAAPALEAPAAGRSSRGARSHSARPEDAPLEVVVVNGNLGYLRLPLMVGHYRSALLTGSELVIDKLMGGAMSASMGMGEYVGRSQTHQVFLNTAPNRFNPLQAPCPPAAIVVGLGEEGKLRAGELIATVRQGVIAWAQRLSHRLLPRSHDRQVPPRFELAATLIGSGGSGISAGVAAASIAQGVREANERLAMSGWPRVSQLQLVEIYLDRATEAWRALQIQAASMPACFKVAAIIRPGIGPLRASIDANYRGTAYDFVSAIAQNVGATDQTVIAYTLDTKRARTELRAQPTQTTLLRELVLGASNDRAGGGDIGRSLFQLLVPPELEPILADSTEIVIELDESTAGLPWELLDTSSGTRDGADKRPWSIRSRLVRKLRAVDFRDEVTDANLSSHALVIGEPDADSVRYPPLPGARAEAQAVAARLVAPGGLPVDGVCLLAAADASQRGPSAREVMNTLLEREWRIVHVSGHGEPPADGDPRGVVLSSGTYLGPREIANMRVVPELVFINCCHLGLVAEAQSLLSAVSAIRYDRPAFAAGVAEQLIKIGVRCVVAAGWAVGDRSAQIFATQFYAALMQGRRFMDAVAEAREATWMAGLDAGDDTWAAYQCYGDPDWTLRRARDGAAAGDLQDAAAEAPGANHRPPELNKDIADAYLNIASPPALALALETIATESRFADGDGHRLRDCVRYLEQRFAVEWGGMGAVAEAFGVAWEECGDRPAAVDWYRRAVSAPDGSASLHAAEQWGALRVYMAAQYAYGRVPLQVVADGGAPVSKASSATSGSFDADERSGASAARHAESSPSERRIAVLKPDLLIELRSAVLQLERLAGFQATVRREMLCGEGYRCLSVLEQRAGDEVASLEAASHMKHRFANAALLGRSCADPSWPIAALNRMAAEWALSAGSTLPSQAVAADATEVREALQRNGRSEPHVDNAAAALLLRVIEAVAARQLASTRAELEADYVALIAQAPGIATWTTQLDPLCFVIWSCTGTELDAGRMLLSVVQGALASR